MLSIGKLVPGAEDYYVQTVARGREEYYTGSGEAPGYWTGEGAKAIGLEGEVDPEHLRAILAGRHPAQDVALVDTAPAKRVVGYDLTFSSPKSVSLLYGFATDEVATAVRTCHDKAVDAALTYVTDHALYARRGHGGAELVATDGLVAAAFRHRTSRAGDPQLHTHVLVGNAVHGVDGKWSAPWASLLYHHGRTAGFVYQGVLRHELATALGVAFTPVANGVAEVAGVDRALIDAFSTRRAEIEARVANLGVTSAKAAQIAALETRAPKDVSLGKGGGVLESLTDTWRRRARQLGHDPDALSRLVGPPRYLDLSDGIVFDIADELAAPGALTATVSTFSRRDVVRAVAERLPDGADYHVIDYTTDRVLSSEQVIALGRMGQGAEERLTTLDLLEIEDRLVDRAFAGVGKASVTADISLVRSVLAGHPALSPEQRAMVERLTTSADAVQVVVGAAGTGKTFALSVAREVWERCGVRVTGAALAARAAGELEDGAGIASSTLASLDHRLSSGDAHFGPDDVLFVDEAGMVGTRMLSRVMEKVTTSGASVVLVGDHHQLPEIETGGAFGSLARRLSAVELTENRRQVHAWERSALGNLRSGDVSLAVCALDDAGRVHEFDSSGEAQEALAADWFAAYDKSPGTARMYAVRRADVDALNEEARRLLRRNRRLGPDIYTSRSGLGFARGEEVMCLRNDRFLGVVNGMSGRVVSGEAAVLTVSGSRGTFHLDEPYIATGNVTYGYASTVHKSQGATVDRAFVLASTSLYREAGYVALSRAREESHLYVVSGAFENGLDRDADIHHLPQQPERVSGLHLPQQPERVRGLVETLSASRAKSMARDQRDLPHPPPMPAPMPSPKRLPEHILDTLGERPNDVGQRRRWEHAVKAIDIYRDRSGFDGSTALGPMPSDSLARMAYRDALNAIVEFENRRERERVRQQPGRDLGLSL